MKKLSIIMLSGLLSGGIASAQNNVGINTATPSASAALAIDTAATGPQGLLIPRMTQARRDAISSPATGLMVYQTNNTPGFYYYTGSAWVPFVNTSTGGAIIPFASGAPITMTTVLGGLLNTSSATGFGMSLTGITASGGIINLTGLNQYAFSVPRAGTITSMSAYFTNSLALTLVASTVTITAQLYASTAPDNNFTAVPGAVVTLAPGMTGILSIGSSFSGNTTGLSIPVTAGTRLMMVYSATVTAGLDVATAVVGFSGGGISIQ